MTSLHRRLRLLELYALVSSAGLFLLLLSAFRQAPVVQRQRFSEIDVERINVIDANGAPRVVISNPALAPGVMQAGKAISPAGGRSGILFYNDERTEAGGLIFSGRKVNGVVTAAGGLTLDQYNQDQAVALQYVDDGGTRRAGLYVQDYPTTMSTSDYMELRKAIDRMPAGAAKDAARAKLRDMRPRLRVYVGRARDDGASLVSLSDGAGRERLRLRVDSAGAASIAFVDATGRVVRELSERKE